MSSFKRLPCREHLLERIPPLNADNAVPSKALLSLPDMLLAVPIPTLLPPLPPDILSIALDTVACLAVLKMRAAEFNGKFLSGIGLGFGFTLGRPEGDGVLSIRGLV